MAAQVNASKSASNPYEEVAAEYLRDSGGNSLVNYGSPEWREVTSALEHTEAGTSHDIEVQGVSRGLSSMSGSGVSVHGDKDNLALAKSLRNVHEDTMERFAVVEHNIEVLNDNLGTLDGNLANLAVALTELRGQFEEYIRRDVRVQAMQRATTERGNLDQELEREFGHNKELRRMAVGMLQATDLAGVRTDTILSSAENLLLTTPNYWLGPALVVLANWIAASQDASQADFQRTHQVMGNMLREAYLRDRNKTALLFGIVCRRAGLVEESNAWFMDYVSFQKPEAVDRTMVMLLNLYSGDAMGRGDVEDGILTTVVGWQYQQIMDPNAPYERQLVNDWKSTCQELIAKAPATTSDFEALRNFSPIWDSLRRSLQASRLHREFSTFMERELARRDYDVSEKQFLDDALLSLVSEFDGAELPLRREREYQQLIIDLDGNDQAARVLRRIKDDILTETKPMVAILTDAARDSRLTSSTAATHVFALRSQLPWIRKAYEEVVAEYRRGTPKVVPFTVGGFKSETTDGTDEAQQRNAFLSFVEKEEREALAKAAAPDSAQTLFIVGVTLLAVGVVLAFIPDLRLLGVILAIVGGIMAYHNHAVVKKAREDAEKIKKQMADKRRYGDAVVAKVCAEVHDWRAEYDLNDGAETDVERMLQENAAEAAPADR